MSQHALCSDHTVVVYVRHATVHTAVLVRICVFLYAGLRGGRGSNCRRRNPSQLRARRSTAPSLHIWGRDARRVAGAAAVRLQAQLHAVRRSASVRRVVPLRWVGSLARVPAVPGERPWPCCFVTGCVVVRIDTMRCSRACCSLIHLATTLVGARRRSALTRSQRRRL